MRTQHLSSCSAAILAAMLAALPFLSHGVDWSSLSGAVTVPEGETWVAYESDMAYVNALSSVTVDGELEFSGCSTCPKANLLLGQGSVRKTGTQVWNLDVDQTNFDGDFHISGGKIVITTAKPFGKTASGCNGAVYVESGATLKIASTTVKFVYRPIHIAGNGYGAADEDKALCIDKAQSGAIGYLYLDADATIYIRNNENHYFVGNQGRPFDNNTGVSVVNLGNYTLTKTGGMNWHFLGPRYIGGTIVSAQGSVTLRESTYFGDGTSGPFKFTSASTEFKFYNNAPVVRRAMEIDNVKVSVVYASNIENDSGQPLLRTNCCNWAGPVSLNGSSAHLAPCVGAMALSNVGTAKVHDLQLSFFGDISGDGKVSVGKSDGYDTAGRIAFGGHNTYTGGTYVYGGMSTRLYAYWHDSIPDYSKLTVSSGYVAVRPGIGTAADGETQTERWPFQKMLDLRNAATFKKDGALAIDASDCPDGVYTIAAADLISGDSRHDAGLGVAGGTVCITSSVDDVLQITPCTYRGTLALTGPGTYSLVGTNALISVARQWTNCSHLVVSGGAKVLQNLSQFYVGRHRSFSTDGTSSAMPSYAMVTVSNATWETACGASPGVESATGFDLGALYVGSMEQGVLEILKDGVVSNKVMVGGGKYTQGTARGEGAVYVEDGGLLHFTPGGAQYHYASSLGYGGYGYLQLVPGGKIRIAGSFGGYGIGVYHQYGGELGTAANTFSISRMNGGAATIYIAGGSVKVKDIQANAGSPSRMFFTVEGEDTVVTADSFWFNSTTTATAIINMNDGATLQVWQLRPYDKTPTSAHPIVINMNGGRFKCTYNSPIVEKRRDLVDFAVYGKGMTMDTVRWPMTQNADLPFVGHVAGGVQSVDASAAVAKNWIGAPDVIITGDGAGASAVADWDYEKRKLRGVKITSPGWGYTQGSVTVTVRTYMQSVEITGDSVQVGDNDIGGFTLDGSNVFSAYATNSWQKWTRIDGGTLKVCSNGAIPSSTELILNGGKLDLNGFAEDEDRPTTFCGLSGTGGTVVNGAVKVVGEWQISASNLLTRTTTALTGTLDLSGVTRIAIKDVDALEAAVAGGITRGALFSATSVIWPQNLEIVGFPDDWRVTKSYDGKGLRMGYVRGLVLIFR